MSFSVIFIMGVSGSGKTRIGQLLAAKTGYAFYDADDFHSQKNIDKMKAGQPLTDEDRWPWLATLQQFAADKVSSENIIIACSALKNIYRQRLCHCIESQCRWVFLKGSYELILQRLLQRKGHYMPPALLRSQFDALEQPPGAIEVDISKDPDEIVDYIISKINK